MLPTFKQNEKYTVLALESLASLNVFFIYMPTLMLAHFNVLSNYPFITVSPAQLKQSLIS